MSSTQSVQLILPLTLNFLEVSYTFTITSCDALLSGFCTAFNGQYFVHPNRNLFFSRASIDQNLCSIF